MSDKSQKQEMQNAQKEHRIPKCLSCNHDIKCVIQRQDEVISWEWDDEEKRFIKDCSGSADTPIHECTECMCEDEDWNFLDENSEANLGVAF